MNIIDIHDVRNLQTKLETGGDIKHPLQALKAVIKFVIDREILYENKIDAWIREGRDRYESELEIKIRRLESQFEHAEDIIKKLKKETKND